MRRISDFKAKILWEPRDIWVGVYWDRGCGSHVPWAKGLRRMWRVYICIVPCLPLRLEWWTDDGARPGCYSWEDVKRQRF